MRIGLDVTSFAFGVNAGIAVYMRRLVESLLALNEETQFMLLFQQRRTSDADAALERLRARGSGRVEVRYGGWRTTGLPVRGGSWLPWQPVTRALVGDVDVFHAGEGALPRADGTPVVATIYDLTTHLFPQHHTTLNRAWDQRRLRWLARQAARVMCISEATRRDLARVQPALAARAVVTPLANASDMTESAAAALRRLAALRAAHGLGDDRYVLTVGTLEPRKNHLRLVHAFGRVAAARPGLRLLLAGRLGWKSEVLVRAVAGSPVRERIHLLGGVSADDLAALYRGATVFAYPSSYEGFGLPLLEAMAAGVPAVTSNVSSLPEVAGEAALLVDPGDEFALAAALDRLLGDQVLRRELSALGIARAAEFNWETTARRTLGAYKAAIADPRQGRVARKV